MFGSRFFPFSRDVEGDGDKPSCHYLLAYRPFSLGRITVDLFLRVVEDSGPPLSGQPRAAVLHQRPDSRGRLSSTNVRTAEGGCPPLVSLVTSWEPCIANSSKRSRCGAVA